MNDLRLKSRILKGWAFKLPLTRIVPARKKITKWLVQMGS
jgi:hypothetical protein